tara:strand:+ start:961 stop:1071 length:111 start_codon:yes stop_codon:yes gene_type:complete
MQEAPSVKPDGAEKEGFVNLSWLNFQPSNEELVGPI